MLLLLLIFCFENLADLFYKVQKLNSENQIFLFQIFKVLMDPSELCHSSPKALEKDLQGIRICQS